MIIRHRWSQAVLFESEIEDVKATLVEAVKKGAVLTRADLTGADLTRADLTGADLTGADLTGADLRGADLRRAVLTQAFLRGADLQWTDLRWAYLTGAYLRGAYLTGAYLTGAKINWQSHPLIAELLRIAAGCDIEKRKVAGLISVSPDWCWEDWAKLSADPLFGWALDVLAGHVTEGDEAPTLLQQRLKTPDLVDA